MLFFCFLFFLFYQGEESEEEKTQIPENLWSIKPLQECDFWYLKSGKHLVWEFFNFRLTVKFLFFFFFFFTTMIVNKYFLV